MAKEGEGGRGRGVWRGRCRQARSRTFLTTGRTQGFALLSRYAPMPWSARRRSATWHLSGDGRRPGMPPTDQVDLVRALVGLEGARQAEEGVLWRLGHGLGGEVCCCLGRHVVCYGLQPAGGGGRRGRGRGRGSGSGVVGGRGRGGGGLWGRRARHFGGLRQRLRLSRSCLLNQSPDPFLLTMPINSKIQCDGPFVVLGEMGSSSTAGPTDDERGMARDGAKCRCPTLRACESGAANQCRAVGQKVARTECSWLRGSAQVMARGLEGLLTLRPSASRSWPLLYVLSRHVKET